MVPLFPVPDAGNANVPWRDDLMVQTFGHGFGIFHMGRALITERYKYVDNDDQLHELMICGTIPISCIT
ncbi:MAG: hypothetical protein R2932_21080 [Caldilineaceae bacterium]